MATTVGIAMASTVFGRPFPIHSFPPPSIPCPPLGHCLPSCPLLCPCPTSALCAKWLSSGPAWQEVEFALRYRGLKFSCQKCNFPVSFLAFVATKTPRQAQVRLRQRCTATCFFRCCCCHDDLWLLMASEMPLGSPVPFTSFTTHPGRRCTAATGPCQQPDHNSMSDHQLQMVRVHLFQLMGKLYSYL
jgi:hypothetical protein